MKLVIKEAALLNEKGSKTKKAVTALLRYIVDSLVTNPLGMNDTREIDVSNVIEALAAKSTKSQAAKEKAKSSEDPKDAEKKFGYEKIALKKVIVKAPSFSNNPAYYNPTNGGSITFFIKPFFNAELKQAYEELKKKSSRASEITFNGALQKEIAKLEGKVQVGTGLMSDLEKLLKREKPKFTKSKTLNDINIKQFSTPFKEPQYLTQEDIFAMFEGKEDPEYSKKTATNQEFKKIINSSEFQEKIKNIPKEKYREQKNKLRDQAYSQAKEIAISNLENNPQAYGALKNPSVIKGKLYAQLNMSLAYLESNQGLLLKEPSKNVPKSTFGHEVRHAAQFGDETLSKQTYKSLGDKKYFLLPLPAPFYQDYKHQPYYGGTTAQSGEGIIGSFYYYTAGYEMDARLVQYNDIYKQLLQQARELSKKDTDEENKQQSDKAGINSKQMQRVRDTLFNIIVRDIEDSFKQYTVGIYPPMGLKDLILNEIKFKMFYSFFSYMKKNWPDLYSVSKEKNEELLKKYKNAIDEFENDPQVTKARLNLGNPPPVPKDTNYK